MGTQFSATPCHPTAGAGCIEVRLLANWENGAGETGLKDLRNRSTEDVGGLQG